MKDNETYDFIGKLAIALYAHGVKISLASLISILKDNGVTYESGRGMAAGVSAAYAHWDGKGDHIVAEAIAYTYTDKDGNFAWKKYRRP